MNFSNEFLALIDNIKGMTAKEKELKIFLEAEEEKEVRAYEEKIRAEAWQKENAQRFMANWKPSATPIEGARLRSQNDPIKKVVINGVERIVDANGD